MEEKRKILAVIPARGGSKGIIRKNIKEFIGKPLICWTIDAARTVLEDSYICVSTDDESIIETVESYSLKVPFRRPNSLATDTSSTNDVIVHAINYYKEIGRDFDWVLLLQPTSPLRNGKHLKDVLELCSDTVDMIVSVKSSHAATVLCQENREGYLRLSINEDGSRRQNMPPYYEYNGAIYLINVKALLDNGIHGIKRIKKYVMNSIESIDIDDICDLELAEFYKIKYNL